MRDRRIVGLAAWALLAALGACGKPAEAPPEAAPPPAAEAPAPTAEAANVSVQYTCENGKTVDATYQNAGDGSVDVEIDGKVYMLQPVVSASGAKYQNQQGMSPGKSLVWWTKGPEAMLIEAPASDDSGEHETLVKCKEVEGAAKQP